MPTILNMIKTIPIWLLLLLLPVSATITVAQDATFYQEKIDHYNSLKNTGSTIFFIGLPVAIAGIIIYKVGVNNLDSDSGDEAIEGFFQIPAGIVATAVGTAGLVTGIILNSIGRQRMNEYQRKLDALKLGLYIAPQQAGIMLTYRF